jgi:hypothetical protein
MRLQTLGFAGRQLAIDGEHQRLVFEVSYLHRVLDLVSH